MVKINLQKKHINFVIIAVIFLIGGGFVYAQVVGSAPNPGHTITELQKCSPNQILKMNSGGTSWTCAVDQAGSLDTSEITSCTGITQKIIWDNFDDRLSCATEHAGSLSCVTFTGSSASSSAIATCDSGIATSGGGACSSTNSYLVGSVPSTNGWTAACRSRTDGSAQGVVAYVVCCTISP